MTLSFLLVRKLQTMLSICDTEMEYLDLIFNSGEYSAPNSNFSKLLELSEMSGARKLIFGLQVSIDIQGGSKKVSCCTVIDISMARQ